MMPSMSLRRSTPPRTDRAAGTPGWVIALVTAGVLLGGGPSGPGTAQAPGGFAGQVAALSEPGGYFDTDNLISNERSYLQIIPDLERGGVRGGAYIGVGPDQNFSYIAHIRPAIAFIVDIRRDNLLLHLLFKAIFAQARTRVEYLALLLGRPVPRELDGWRQAGIARLVAYHDAAAIDRESVTALRRRLEGAVTRFGVALSAEDLATIDRFHRRFIDAGLELRFQSTGRPPQSHYPTYRQLLLEIDSSGHHANFLASEDGFQFVKSLHARDRIIPVVGDLGGPKALAAVGRLLSDRREQLSAFYTSNVEYYLERSGTYPRFTNNLARIPRSPRAVVIRSIFGRFTGGSTTLVLPVSELLANP
jgi:hypothetical protein